MGLQGVLRQALRWVVRRYDYEVIDVRQLYPWQHIGASQQTKTRHIPEEAVAYLRPDSPRLTELRRRYAQCPSTVTESRVWTSEHVSANDLRFFRGDNAYVWQLRGANMNVLGYALTAYYVKAIDSHDLLGLLEEDDAFGNSTFTVAGKIVSGDLLDSIIEMYFLEKHLTLSGMRELAVVDIGAGYGRLAHRMSRGFPTIGKYYCTDAIPESSFLSEYYVGYRGLSPKVVVVPLDTVDKVLMHCGARIAINVHSFSECTLPAINWWLSLLAKGQVEYLMIVPNPLGHGGTQLQTNEGEDFSPLLHAHGYRLVAREPKYRDPIVQTYGIMPTYHYLFRQEKSSG